jgi:hypothetical protein
MMNFALQHKLAACRVLALLIQKIKRPGGNGQGKRNRYDECRFGWGNREREWRLIYVNDECWRRFNFIYVWFTISRSVGSQGGSHG